MTTIYAIGDIHSHIDPLKTLHERIVHDRARHDRHYTAKLGIGFGAGTGFGCVAAARAYSNSLEN